MKLSYDPAFKSPKTSLKTLLADTLTVFWGDWLDLRVRIPQIAASGLVSPLIYILAFGLGLGSSLDRVSMPTAGDSYLEFILPGMVALSSMVISFGGTTFSICGERLFSKTFEEMLLYPIHPLALHLGKMLAGIVRGLMTASAVIVLAVLFYRQNLELSQSTVFPTGHFELRSVRRTRCDCRAKRKVIRECGPIQ